MGKNCQRNLLYGVFISVIFAHKYNGVQSKPPFYQFMMLNEVTLREQK